MRRKKFVLILCFVLTTAFALSACGSSVSSDRPVMQSSDSSGAVKTAESSETAGTTKSAKTTETAVSTETTETAGTTESAETAEGFETAGTDESAETVGAQAVTDPEEAGGSDTAAGTAAFSADPCPSISAEEYPRVDGSTATLPLSYALYQAAVGVDEEAAMEAVSHNKTDRSYRLLANGDCDLVLAYEPSEETREYVEENADVEMKPIGRDALIFMINSSNPVKSLTEAQLQSVYSGETTNWKELGGKDEEIVAFQRKQNSGSQTMMEKLVMGDIPMAEAPSHYIIDTMGGLLDQVSSYNNQGNAIGYSVYFYARNMYSVPGLEFLSVDSVAPSNETIQDGSYPYVNEFYAVIRGDEPNDSSARLLFDWLTDEGGQELIADTGYVPVLEKHPAEGDASPAFVVTEAGEVSYDLKEDEVILMNGSSWFNSPAVHIMNADMTERGIIEGYSLAQSSNLDIWSVNEPLILMDASSGKRGLYDIGSGKWILEPDYSIMYRISNGEYICTVPGQNTSTIFNGTDTLQIESHFLRAGDYYWIEDDTGYSIRKGIKEISGHVDVADPEQSRIRIQFNNYVLLDYGADQNYLYTDDGELIFKPEYLQSEFENWQDVSYSISSCTNAKGLVLIEIRGEDTKEKWIYDIETGDFLSLGDVDVNKIVYNKKRDYAFQIAGEYGLSILTDSLEPLKASDGTPYEYCFGMDCCGYQDIESGNIVVENPDGSIHFELPYHEDGAYGDQGEMIARGVILYADEDREHYELTRYGNLLGGSDSAYWHPFGGTPGEYNTRYQEYKLLCMGKKIFTIRIDTGDIAYQTLEGSLVETDHPVLVFKSGNYLYFRDPDGNLVMKVFADRYVGE